VLGQHGLRDRLMWKIYIEHWSHTDYSFLVNNELGWVSDDQRYYEFDDRDKYSRMLKYLHPQPEDLFSGYELQGTGYDPGACGYELQGRASKPKMNHCPYCGWFECRCDQAAGKVGDEKHPPVPDKKG